MLLTPLLSLYLGWDLLTFFARSCPIWKGDLKLLKIADQLFCSHRFFPVPSVVEPALILISLTYSILQFSGFLFDLDEGHLEVCPSMPVGKIGTKMVCPLPGINILKLIHSIIEGFNARGSLMAGDTKAYIDPLCRLLGGACAHHEG